MILFRELNCTFANFQRRSLIQESRWEPAERTTQAQLIRGPSITCGLGVVKRRPNCSQRCALNGLLPRLKEILPLLSSTRRYLSKYRRIPVTTGSIEVGGSRPWGNGCRSKPIVLPARRLKRRDLSFLVIGSWSPYYQADLSSPNINVVPPSLIDEVRLRSVRFTHRVEGLKRASLSDPPSFGYVGLHGQPSLVHSAVEQLWASRNSNGYCIFLRIAKQTMGMTG